MKRIKKVLQKIKEFMTREDVNIFLVGVQWGMLISLWIIMFA